MFIKMEANSIKTQITHSKNVDFSFKIYVRVVPLEGLGGEKGGWVCDFISLASFILRTITQGQSHCQLIPILSTKRKIGDFNVCFWSSWELK